jgi:hypothetical protein
MKKIILHSLFCITCFAFITGCSKNVKAPAKKSTATTNTTTITSTQTQDTNQQGHTCGGGSNQSSNYGDNY